MSEPIKAGDLVRVVRGHECTIGFMFVVSAILPQRNGGWWCPRCNTRDIARDEKWGASKDGSTHGIPLPWLKRILPLGELDGEKRDEEITA